MQPALKKSLLLLFWLVLIIIIAVFGLYVYFNGLTHFRISFSKPVQQTLTTSSGTPSAFDNLSAEDQLQSFRSKNKIQIPAISSTSPASVADLPQQISKLLTQASGEQVQSVIFVTQAVGWHVGFQISKNGGQAFLSFIQSLDHQTWNLVSATNTDKAGVVGLDSQKYQISMEFAQITDAQTQVEMIVVGK